MRWSRLFIVAVFLGLLGCSSATAPRYPQPEEDDGSEPDPNKHGLVIFLDGSSWA